VKSTVPELANLSFAATLQDVRSAFAFLTVLPLHSHAQQDGDRARGHVFAWFPLVGFCLGLVLALVAWLPAPPLLRSFLVLAAWVGATGALHLDGFADACDGLGATTTPDRRLEIMKDSRAGSWAIVGVTLLMLGKFASIPNVNGAVLIAAAVGGRWAMVVAAAGFPYARATGIGGYFREGLGARQVLIATLCAFCAIVGAGLVNHVAFLALMAPAVAFFFGRWAAAHLGGGLTGDIYGATCELTELLILVGAALWAA
jgi:adenosylcobinamide-GDP ribazoletransferase